MRTFELNLLLAALSPPALKPASNARVSIAQCPAPFVEPTLSTSDSAVDDDPFAAEVVLISAPAAVGKSTLARFISSSASVPLLNLANTPVSTHSLVGILQSDFEGSANALEAFHKGQLPIIIDALDEGRLLTGEKGFEQFLVTTAELLLRDRSATKTPKLVIFGRSGSAAFASLAMAYFDEHLVREFAIDFFAESRARQLIESYGDTLSDSAQSLHDIEPAQRVINAYFQAIERALSLPPSTLWRDGVGCAFAGYAPVLATLGEALAREKNFQVLENRLRRTASSHGDAWAVLAEVIAQMLSREAAQLRSKFPLAAQQTLTDAVYDPREQLGFLARFLDRKPIRGTGCHPLSGALADTYYSLVEQKLPEHPFIDAEEGRPRNAIFAAAILAHGITIGLEFGSETAIELEEAARQPFLWRFFESALQQGSLIDGRFLGYLLSSLRTDPIATGVLATIGDAPGGGASVRVEGASPRLFDATTPIVLFGMALGIDAGFQGDLVLRGASAVGGRASFSCTGRNVLRATKLVVESDDLVLDGYVWMEANEVSQSSRLHLQIKAGARYGWGPQIASIYPWSAYKSVVSAPDAREAQSVLTRLLLAFVQHLGSAPRPFYVAVNFGALDGTEYGERANWMARDFGPELPQFVRGLVQHGLASAEPISGQRDKRLKVSLECSWEELLAAAARPEEARPQVQAFVSDLNRTFSRPR